MIDVSPKRERLIKENLGLVYSCADRFKGKGVEYDDLFQAGCVGLIRAVDGFDESRGFSFSTYAVPAILGEIKRIFRDGGTVKVGRTLKEKARKASSEREKLSKKLGREPTISELAETLGTDISEASFILNASLPVISLTYGGEEGEGSETEIPVPPPDEDITKRLSLEKAISELPERDKQIIEMRYFKGMTQTKIASALNMTQVQVSRREKAILLQIREKMNV